MGFFDTLLTPDARYSTDVEKMKNKKNVKGLIKALSNENESVRSSAAQALGEIGDVSAVEPLVIALGAESKSVYVSMYAEEAIKKMGPPIAAIKPLAKMMQNTDHKQAASRLLAGIGEHAVDSLIFLLKNNDNSVRKHAAHALGEIGDTRAVDSLILLLKDNDREVRYSVIEAIGKIGGPKAISILIQDLKSPDPDPYQGEKFHAAKLLEDAGWQPKDAITKAHFLLAMEDIQALDAIIEEIKMDPQITDLLIKKLENEKYYIRESAAKALGKIKDPRAIEPLIGRLYDSGDYTPGGTNLIYSDGDFNHIDCVIGEETYDGHYDGGDYVRIAAANAIENISEALGKIGDTQAVDLLIQALKDENPDIQKTAARALGKIGNTQAVDPLIQALKDENPDIQKTAARALGELKAINAVDSLKQAFRDKDEGINMRMCYAEALGKIGDTQAVDLLIQALKDENPDIQKTAARALGELKAINAVDPLKQAFRDKEEDINVRMCYAEALGKIGDAKFFDQMIQDLNDVDSHIKYMAANALGKSKSIQAVDSLIHALADKDPLVRLASAIALGEIGDAKAVNPLSQTLKDEDLRVRKGAAEAWKKLESVIK